MHFTQYNMNYWKAPFIEICIIWEQIAQAYSSLSFIYYNAATK